MLYHCISGHPLEDDAEIAAIATLPGFVTHRLCAVCALDPLWRDELVRFASLRLATFETHPAWDAAIATTDPST